MKRFVIGLGALAIVFGLSTSPLFAAGHGHPGHGNGHGVHFNSGHRSFGVRGLHNGYGGYLHSGYRGWSRYYWNARYRCNFYFCPQAGCYYYYYGPGTCYLPMSCINTYPPTVGINNNVNVNVNTVSPGLGSPGPIGQPMPGPMMP